MKWIDFRDIVVPTFLVIIILILPVLALVYGNTVLCFLKHGTISEYPPDYKMVTNGEKYSFINPEGNIILNQPSKSKTDVVVDMWWDYDFKQKLKRRMREKDTNSWTEVVESQ